MKWLFFLLVAAALGVGRPAGAQAPGTEAKPAEAPDWASLLGFDRPSAQARYDDERTPEGWAWTRIKRDEVADLNLRCDPTAKTRLDSRVDAGWDDACRKIPAGFLADVLTDQRWRDRIRRHGLRLQGARIDGDLDLVNADIRSDLRVTGSRIDGALDLTGAHAAGVLSLQGTRLRGDLVADRLRADTVLLVHQGATIAGSTSLRAARVGGLDMSGAAFGRTVDAAGLAVERSLLLNGGATFKGNLVLRGARIGGAAELDHSTFEGNIEADGLSVDGSMRLNGSASFKGLVLLRGARVGGHLTLDGSGFAQAVDADSLSVGASLSLRNGASFLGKLVLSGAKVSGAVVMDGASFFASVETENLSAGGSLFLRGAVFKADLGLRGVRAGADVALTGSAFEQVIEASNLAVGGDLSLGQGATFKGDVSLRGATVGGQAQLDSAAFDSVLDAANLAVRGDMSMRRSVMRKTVTLIGARVAGKLDIDRVLFEGPVDAASLDIKGDLTLRNGTSFKAIVNLAGARVGGQLLLIGSTFQGTVEAETLAAGGSILAYGTRFVQPVSFVSAHIGGGLNLSGAVANRIDLTNAIIAQDLTLGDGASSLQWLCGGLPSAAGTIWPLGEKRWLTANCEHAQEQAMPALILRNAYAGGLQDQAGAWPPGLDLEGFRYGRIGGITGTGAADMRTRSAEQWQDWLDRDPSFSTQPYAQLAGVLAQAGNRQVADDIAYAARERERRDAIQREDWYTAAWLTFLCNVAGYGIGFYTFRVLAWVGGLTAAGAFLLLAFAPKARRNGILWCFGASLQKLLPIAEFNRSFRDFFDNPPPATSWERRNLGPRLAATFSLLALAGWVLGFALLSALSTPSAKG